MAPFQGRTVSFREGISSGCLKIGAFTNPFVFFSRISETPIFGTSPKNSASRASRDWALAFCKLVLMDPPIQSLDVPGTLSLLSSNIFVNNLCMNTYRYTGFMYIYILHIDLQFETHTINIIYLRILHIHDHTVHLLVFKQVVTRFLAIYKVPGIS